MRRGLVLGTLIGVAALSMVVSGQAPGPSAASIKATQIEKVKDNLYIITGSGAETPQRSAAATSRCSSRTLV